MVLKADNLNWVVSTMSRNGAVLAARHSDEVTGAMLDEMRASEYVDHSDEDGRAVGRVGGEEFGRGY